MCGLVGMMGSNFIHSDSKILYHLLHLDVLRGKDSTGVFFMYTDNTYEVLKSVGVPDHLYYKYNVKDCLFNLQNVKTVIGHNRWMTQGNISEEHAHPFDIGDVVGAHNGTIEKFYLKNLEDHDKYDIDSQILFAHIDKKGIADLWSKVSGPMALTWVTKTDEKLHIIRNDKRPLHYYITDCGKRLYWASEPWMLVISLSKNGEKFKDIKEFEVDIHHTISFKDGKIDIQKEKLSPYVFTYKGSVNHGHADWYGGGSYNTYKNDYTSTSDHVLFAITDWRTTIINSKSHHKNPGLPSSGYFVGSTGFEPVKIIVKDVDESVLNIINRINNSTEEGVYEAKHVYYSYLAGGGKQGKLRDLVPTAAWENVLEVVPTEYTEVCGSTVSRGEWIKLTKNGCSYCCEDLEWEDRDKIVWKDKETPICKLCEIPSHKKVG